MKVRGLCVTGDIDPEGERLTDAALDDVAARIVPPLRSFWKLLDWRRVPNGVEVTIDLPEKARTAVEAGSIYACIAADGCERDPEWPRTIIRVTSSVSIQIQNWPPIGTQGPMRIVEETDPC